MSIKLIKNFMLDILPAIVKPEYIDLIMTEKVQVHLAAKKKSTLEMGDKNSQRYRSFEKVRLIYESLLQCDDLQSPMNYAKDVLVKDKNSATLSLCQLSIPASNCISFSIENSYGYNDPRNKDKRFVIFIFPTTILLFADVQGAILEFICALIPTAFTLTFEKRTIDRDIVVRETSREPIEYYEKFNPTPDSKILHMQWKVTNSDGSRSFRGGLSPYNNPLHFQFEYGVLTFNLCGVHLTYGFSNSEKTELLYQQYTQYYAEMGKFPVTGDVAQKDKLILKLQKKIKKWTEGSFWSKLFKD